MVVRFVSVLDLMFLGLVLRILWSFKSFLRFFISCKCKLIGLMFINWLRSCILVVMCGIVFDFSILKKSCVDCFFCGDKVLSKFEGDIL